MIAAFKEVNRLEEYRLWLYGAGRKLCFDRNCSAAYGLPSNSKQLSQVTEFLIYTEYWIFLPLTFEPSHEITVLFVCRKLILQTCMSDFWLDPSSTSMLICVRTAKALARLHGCAGSPEPSLVAYVTITIISQLP